MSKLDYFRVEATLNGQWVDLNDGDSFKVSSDSTLVGTAKSWRKITATSPVLDGDYLIHATLGMVSEQMAFFVYGYDHVDLAEKYALLEEIFDQFEFRIRITFDSYREYWECECADTSIDRSQTMAHNRMAKFTATIPRHPVVAREEIF